MASAKSTWTDFAIVTEIFKTVDGHDIKADVALPLGSQPGLHPLIIAYHGGYLISGSRNHYMFIAAWLPAYAIATNAVVVLPDYRLLPSASVADIRSDVEDLWTWVRQALPSVMERRFPQHLIDLDKILLEGNSAGGFCVAHLALDHATQIRGAIMVYPMLDCLSDHLQYGPSPSASASAPIQGSELQKRIENARFQGWVSERSTRDDILLTISVMNTGEFGAMFGRNTADNPTDRLKNDANMFPSRLWILHGKDDSGVPAQGSVDFCDETAKKGWAEKVQLDVIVDEPSGHGFDASWSINDEKMARRLDWINATWLK